MDIYQVFDLINSSTASSGGTSDGLSRDEKASACGLSAAFSEALPAHTFSVPMQFLDLKGKPRVIGNRAGSAFHALQEAWGTGKLHPRDLPVAKDFEDVDAAVGAAVMALKRYAGQNLEDLNYLGDVIGSEMPISGTIAGEYRTGRLDRVLQVSQEQADRWAQYGIFTVEPGVYLWDFKLLKAVTLTEAAAHQRKMQLLAYMKMYEQQTGVRPQGAVYELVSRAANPSESRLLALVPNNPHSDRIVSDFVQLATVRRAEGKADSSKCDNRYGPCPFISICPRFGDRHEHADLISNHALLKQVALEVDE